MTTLFPAPDPSNPVESLRKHVVSQLFEIKTFESCWPTWQKELGRLAPHKTATEILDLGDHLGVVFKSTARAGGGESTNASAEVNSAAAAGGVAWESLVAWYTNLCLIGTRTVVIKKRSDVPVPVRDALTVTYRNVQANTESDLVAVTFPARVLDEVAPRSIGGMKRRLDELAEKLSDLKVMVIQCKTNWNDNAQIPMMWDMIYAAQGFIDRLQITVGVNNYHLAGQLRYAFVTVPSNPKAKYTSESAPVMRVLHLTGGNYWGRKSENGVANSIKEIFSRMDETTDVRSTLNGALSGLGSSFSYFQVP